MLNEEKSVGLLAIYTLVTSTGCKHNKRQNTAQDVIYDQVKSTFVEQCHLQQDYKGWCISLTGMYFQLVLLPSMGLYRTSLLPHQVHVIHLTGNIHDWHDIRTEEEYTIIFEEIITVRMCRAMCILLCAGDARVLKQIRQRMITPRTTIFSKRPKESVWINIWEFPWKWFTAMFLYFVFTYFYSEAARAVQAPEMTLFYNPYCLCIDG